VDEPRGTTRNDASSSRLNRFNGMDGRFGYLKFMYHNPVTDSNMPFPGRTPVHIIYVDNGGSETRDSHNPFQINGADGTLTFFIEHRTNLYFEIQFGETAYLNLTSGTIILQSELDSQLQSGGFDLRNNMIFMLPQRFNLKNSIWSIDNVPVFDRERRMFVNLEANPLNGGSGHLPVILTPEWQYIGFQYYDRHAKTKQMMPQYTILRGYNEDVDEDNPVTRSNVFKDNCICVPWIEDRNSKNVRNPEKIVLKFGTSETFIESGGGIVRRTRDQVRAMPLRDRFRYYDLPEVWSSKNWKAKFGQNSTNVSPFQDRNVVNGNTTASNPLVFELDSVVLTDDDLECESSWEQNNRFTVFDIKMKITNPETNKPYWANGTVDRNFFPMRTTLPPTPTDGDHPRVLYVNDKFHDITDKRSTDGDVIGARAAVLNDESVHYGENLEKPYHSVAGNSEVHYFKDCLDTDDSVISALIIFWSCKFEADSGVSAADVDNFRRSGMQNTKERWGLKNYRFRPRNDPSSRNIIVKPIFFYEARSNDPYKCDVTVHPSGQARSSMGISEGNFMSSDYQSGAPGAGDTDIDGNSFGRFTMSHEVGHAMGLMDEYVESLEEDNINNVPGNELWSPPLPIFDQPFIDGRPYPWDELSMMNSNKAPRLRHLWHFSHWMNETDEVKNLTGNTVFQVNYNSQNFNYFLPNSMNNFYEPAEEERNVSNGDYGEFDLRLYKIGSDELTKIAISGQSGFDGVLVVRSRLQWFFESYSTFTWANINEKIRYLRNFETSIRHEMNGKYYLECSADSDFKKVYVFFSPHYYFEGSTIHDHFEITVKANTGASVIFQPEFFQDGFDDDDFEVDARQNPISIYRYVLGLSPYTGSGASKVSNNSINANELNFLVTWINNKRGRTYQLRT